MNVGMKGYTIEFTLTCQSGPDRWRLVGIENLKIGQICWFFFNFAVSFVRRSDGIDLYADKAGIWHRKAHHRFTTAYEVWLRSASGLACEPQNSKFGQICSFSPLR